MGELIFVGLGLGVKGVSLAGIEAIAASDVTYLERYTTPSPPDLLQNLERATGKQIQLIERALVEDGKKILDDASTSRVVLAVQGDPMIATTHSDLRVRANSRGIRTKVVHGSTIPAAAASVSGLHYYKFGPTITFTRESTNNYQSVYQRIHRNLLEGLHTLLLLEYDVENEDGVEPQFAVQRLLDAERNYQRGVLSERTFIIVLSRIGMADQEMRGGEISMLKDASFGGNPHCIIFPGRLHFTEAEALASVLSLNEGAIQDNSAVVRRTAQVLVPRYVEKAKKALKMARKTLKDRHHELLENAELYMNDAENFIANDQDELAMLSVGYAEGLIDALSFTGEVELNW